MKEWKNNPESDDDTKADKETEQHTEEKLKHNKIEEKALNVNHSPSAKSVNQVGGMAAAGHQAAGTFSLGTLCCSSIISLLVGNRGLH